MTARHERQTLLCDADDTLWENNAYFLDVLVRFLDLMEAAGVLRLDAERTLREIEARRTKTSGYGSLNYALSLAETYEAMVGPLPAAERAVIERLGREIYDHPIELLPGVAATIAELAGRHELWIVTKGHFEEQTGKIRRSGIEGVFKGREILKEKDVAAYREMAVRRGFDGTKTWMIGNSPRSDMNPAALAGLKTAFVPHRTIWEFEKAEFVRPPDLELAAFADLLDYF